MQITDSSHITILEGTGNDKNNTTSSASTLSFSTQPVGSPSAPQTITVTNISSVPLNIVSVNTTAEFEMATDTCTSNSPILVNATCTVSVDFDPALTGPLTGTLTVADDAIDGTLVIPLTGTGVAPTAIPSATSLDFGNEAVGTASVPKAITLSNGGTAPLAISSIVISGNDQSDFAVQSSSTCSTTTPMGVGASCSVIIVFTAQAGGGRSAQMSISDNAGGSPQLVALTGTGLDFAISMTPTSASVSAGAQTTFIVTLTPVGGFAGALQISCTGAPSEATCTPKPTSATLNGSSTAQVTLNVTTTAASFAPSPWYRWIPFRNWPLPMAISVFWVLLLTLLAAVRALKQKRAWVALSGAAVISLTFISCGAGTTVSSGGRHDPGTPAGNSILTVSATSGSTTHSATVSLAVTH